MPKLKLEDFSAVIFDNDGLLQVNEIDYEWAFKNVCAKYGCPPPNNQTIIAVKGIDFRDVHQLICEDTGLELTFQLSSPQWMRDSSTYASTSPWHLERLKS